MQGLKLFRSVRPFISAIAVIASAAALVVTIYFTNFDLRWITFLTGVLVAAVLAEATRVSRAEWFVRRRTSQLLMLKSKLENETQLRKRAEEAFAASKSRTHLLDEMLPIKVMFVDTEGHCQYHNHALRDWLHRRAEQINDRHLRDLLGPQFYQNIAESVRQSLAGQPVHYERIQRMPDGMSYRLAVDHFPEFAEDGRISGFYMLIMDSTASQHPSAGTGNANVSAATPAAEVREREFVDPFSRQTTMREDAGALIMAAIEKDEFCLYCQRITPVTPDSGKAEHYEILVRLKEEEESMMLPGAFFPLAEKYGLMPHLDRWVVQHLAEWVRNHPQTESEDGGSMYFINVSGATLGDPGFPEFLQQTLQEHAVPAGALCFEIPNSELDLRGPVVVEFAQRIRQHGCRVAISGFGHGRILFDQISGFQVEFLKIDGSVILGFLRDPVALAKVTSINRVAKKIGVRTVAEMVESDEAIARLKEIGIDYAQGFGISRPQPLGDTGCRTPKAK